jgi:hypothetical protein
MKRKTLFLIMMFVAAGSLLSAQGLKVEPGTCIKLETGTTLDISGGDLFLESDATGDASLIDLGSVNYSGGGQAMVERYFTQGKWHLVSSPIIGAQLGMFEEDFLQYHTESTNAYSDLTSLTYGLIPAKGYALWSVLTEPSNEVFAGITNTGNQSYNFTQNGQGWNLIGNPYPSVLDWDEVTIPGQLSGAIWLFDPTVGANGDYKYYISGGGEANTTTQYIPSGQGFFVRATSGAGTLQFDNTDRTHGGQAFYKSDVENRMLVLKATGNNITTQTAIRFNADATAQVDRLYDVFKITSGSPDVPVVYTKCENQNMAINTLPSIAGNETVPVYFETGMDGTYTFTATEMETLGDAVPLFLEDISLNYTQDLRANPAYSFEYTSGEVREFNIHFKDVTGIEHLPQNSIRIYSAEGQIIIKGAESGKFMVLDVMGRIVLQQNISASELTVIPVNLKTGVYVVMVSSGACSTAQHKTEKIFIK